MRLSDWLRSLRGRIRRSKIRQFTRRPTRMARSCERLEERALPSAVGNTIATAQNLTPISGGSVQIIAAIGDEPDALMDWDLFQIDLTAGQQLTGDIDALTLDTEGSLSALNSDLRRFDANGTLLASNDDGRDPETNVRGGDSLLMFTAPTTGTYYLGVSSALSGSYDPVAGTTSSTLSGATAETGAYQLKVSVVDGDSSCWKRNGPGLF